MRNLPFILVLALVVSCGKNSISGPSPKRGDSCSLNGESVKCEAMEAADGQGVDLLDTVIDVNIEISGPEITFQESKVSRQEGRRISCETEVRNGEVYHYSLNGNKLQIQTGGGSYVMTRLNDEGTDLLGAWSWKGYVDRGTHVIRTMTFVSRNRVIIKNHCEL